MRLLDVAGGGSVLWLVGTPPALYPSSPLDGDVNVRNVLESEVDERLQAVLAEKVLNRLQMHQMRESNKWGRFRDGEGAAVARVPVPVTPHERGQKRISVRVLFEKG